MRTGRPAVLRSVLDVSRGCQRKNHPRPGAPCHAALPTGMAGNTGGILRLRRYGSLPPPAFGLSFSSPAASMSVPALQSAWSEWPHIPHRNALPRRLAWLTNPHGWRRWVAPLGGALPRHPDCSAVHHVMRQDSLQPPALLRDEPVRDYAQTHNLAALGGSGPFRP